MGSGRRRALWKKSTGYKRKYKKYHMPGKRNRREGISGFQII